MSRVCSAPADAWSRFVPMVDRSRLMPLTACNGAWPRVRSGNQGQHGVAGDQRLAFHHKVLAAQGNQPSW
jgi:hypothetical protein